MAASASNTTANSQRFNMSNSPSPAPVDTASSAYLRRRSGQQEASNIASGSSSHQSQGIASRRQSGANDLSFKLTSLNEASESPPLGLYRPTTPTASANSPVSVFGKQRAAVEIQAVANMVASNDIQRPASAPPRGSRSRHTNKEVLDDIGAEMLESAQIDFPKSSASSIKETALDVMHLFTSNLSDRSLALLFLFIVMWGAVLSLDRLTTYSYQTIATNSFSSHSSLAMVNVIRAVVAAVAAFPFAVIADLCGRYQAFAIALALYASGHTVMAASTNIPSYIGGIVLYETGANALVCLQYTVLADVTSSRNRLFFQMLPQMPFLVFSFVSSDIYSAILPRWRWGIGMFAILGPISLFPVVWILHTSQKGQKAPAVTSTQSLRRASIQQSSPSPVQVFLLLKHVWKLADVSGLVLLAGSLGLILVPLTLAASSPDRWENAKILGMICTGAVLAFLFILWETKHASHPILAKMLLRNRTFWGGGATLCLLWTAHAIMISFFPTYLYVVHNTSNRAQQNLSVIYSFTVAASSLPVALMVRYSRRYKIFALIGVVLFTAGLGLMISLHSNSTIFHIVASQVVIGLGGAMTIALIMAAVQVSVPHDYVAHSIAAINVFPCLGNAIGAAVAGALWSNALPGDLIKDLASSGHTSDVHNVYSEPLTWIESYPIGTAARTGVIEAYSTVWRLLMITATVVCAASALSTMGMKNLVLNDFLSTVEESDKRGAAQGHTSNEKEEKLFGDRFFEGIEEALWRFFARHSSSKTKRNSDADDDVDTSAADGRSTRKSKWAVFSKKTDSSTTSSNRQNMADGDKKEMASFSAVDVMPPFGLAPILVIDRADDEEIEGALPYSAPAGPSNLFRPPHPSPLRRSGE
jgi:SIT family siderophore-iron:H+ symporter-like MFS transporter